MRKLFITAKVKSRKEAVTEVNEDHFIVSVREAPIHGEANKAILQALARYYNIAPSRFEIISGQKSKNKTIIIV